jgi:hypothetical protein
MSKVETALVGTMDYALQECARPDVKTTKSVLLSTTLRFGNVEDENLHEEAISLAVRTSKATAITRPPTMGRFVRKERELNRMDWEGDGAVRALEEFAPVNRRTDYYIEKRPRTGRQQMNQISKQRKLTKTTYNWHRENLSTTLKGWNRKNLSGHSSTGPHMFHSKKEHSSNWKRKRVWIFVALCRLQKLASFPATDS